MIGAEKEILGFLNRYKQDNYIGVYSYQTSNKREKYTKVLRAHGKYAYSKNGHENLESFKLQL